MADDWVTISNSALLALMTEEDREIARAIYNAKRHLPTPELVDLAYMMGKARARPGMIGAIQIGRIAEAFT